MALRRPREEDDMGFIQHWGRMGSVKTVTVTPGQQMPERGVQELQGLSKSGAIDFEVEARVFDGDVLEWDDRGSRQRALVTEVEVFDAPMASSFMKHISAKYSKDVLGIARRSAGSASGGHMIIVNGNNVNVAVDGSTISTQVKVAEGFENLADAVGRALAVIEETSGVDPDEVEAARESATRVVEETSKPSPDPGLLKKLLLPLKAVLMSAATAGAGAAATALVSQLVV